MVKRKRQDSEIENSPSARKELEPVETAPLTPAEERDLISIESRIASGLSAFFDVAYALMEIKQRRLYRAEFVSFEDYCRIRWDMRRAHAYRLIGAAEICSHL